MHSFASSTLSLPVSPGSARPEKKTKRSMLRRLSLGKTKTASSISSTSTVELASRSTVTLAVAPGEESSSRHAFDLFSTRSSPGESSKACASMPSSPRTPRASTSDAASTNRKMSGEEKSARSRSFSSLTRRSTNARFKDAEAQPVPELPKMVLISDEVFIIAASPSKALPELPASSGASSSFNSSGSWLDSLPTPSEEVPAFPKCPEQPRISEASERSQRSSFDEIDAQMITNLCEVQPPKREPVAMVRSQASQGAQGSPRPPLRRGLSRSASARAAPPVPTVPEQFTRSHVRSGSAPHTLGPLPPQPSQPPSDEVLRKTDRFKKRYSRQAPSPLASPVLEHAAFSLPRSAPPTPKLDTVAALINLEAGLSLDSKLARRNHRRSTSRTGAATLDSAFKPSTSIRLTAGHSAAADEQTAGLVSRFSEDSDSESASRLRLLLSPVLGSVAKLPPLLGTSSTSLDSHSMPETSVVETKSPELPALCGSSISSASDHEQSDLSPTVSIELDHTLFDLSRQSMDYKTVYALAQQYAKNAAPQSNHLSTTKPTSLKPPPPPKAPRQLYLNSLWSKPSRNLPDPVDRSYHLRK